LRATIGGVLRRTHVSSPCVIIPIHTAPYVKVRYWHSANAQTAPMNVCFEGIIAKASYFNCLPAGCNECVTLLASLTPGFLPLHSSARASHPVLSAGLLGLFLH
jgi:hypothetical protein